MIAALILASFFMILILLAVLMVAFHIKKWVDEHKKDTSELKKMVNDTQSLFKVEVQSILDQFKNLLK